MHVSLVSPWAVRGVSVHNNHDRRYKMFRGTVGITHTHKGRIYFFFQAGFVVIWLCDYKEAAYQSDIINHNKVNII